MIEELLDRHVERDAHSRMLGRPGAARKFFPRCRRVGHVILLPIMRRVLVALALLVALPAAAQSPGPTLPMGMDIRKAPVGAWSEYTVTVADLPPFKQRFALVSRDAATHSVEMTSEGGTMANGPRATLKVILEADPAKKERVRQLIMQLADNDPMELKQAPGAQSKDQFAPLDPRKQIGKETVKVAAGSFATRHYREKTASGAMDVWVSDEAPPFGIVKMRGSASQGGDTTYPITIELAARGKDAKAIITKPPQPFDPAVLMGQMNRAVGNQAPKGK
jgi:hypothetical protein